ncbi:transmembrane channel-like protein 7 isoform X2 [Physella acuta]|uniref:transmembrane channel-like protein 7 isoform X2 n=1 Tax=Physella acuta TaxID=109671 RepID=UPI0027DCCE9E|nr:transmembrane channel-like protein 7 isoform X2 [Physella acuta]XP_059152886.1 transmembrane channel-like protein 7 isoform X2 [Physella acuta]
MSLGTSVDIIPLTMDADDLRLLIVNELPSSHKRRCAIYEQRLSMHRVSVRPQSNAYRNINQDNDLIHGLADSIVNKNDLNIPTFNNRKRLSTVHDSHQDYSLRNRITSLRDIRNSAIRSTSVDVAHNTDDDDSSLQYEFVPVKTGQDTVDSTRHLLTYPKRIVKGLRASAENVSDFWHRLNFWTQQFREIEGHFGIATSTYFRFTRWLVNINFIVFFLYLCFIYIPQLTYSDQESEIHLLPNTSDNYFHNNMVRCSRAYKEKSYNVSSRKSVWMIFLDIAQGTGRLQNTMLFYGYYTNLTFKIIQDPWTTHEVKYNMGLSYMLTVGFSFIVVFIMIVKNSSSTIKESVMDFDNKAFPLYTNSVFGGWDYCINSEKMAVYKQRMIYNEFKTTIQEFASRKKREGRSRQEKTRLIVKRTVINILVLVLLAGSFYTIYITTDFLLRKQNEHLSDILYLLLNYLPSIVISFLNVAVPEIFLALSAVEEYSHSFATHITIVRAVFLRLSSVWVLITSVYYRLQQKARKPYDCPQENKVNVTRCCGNTLWESAWENDKQERGMVPCWESYVGQQFYKLCITDFISVTMIVFVIKIPRRIIHHNLHNKVWIVQKLGRAKFDLPLQVLDIVYSQSVCWMGMFFTPILPALTFLKVFFFFFLKKFELLNVTETPKIAYRASRSYSFFQSVLLVSFITISCLLGYMISNLQPSKSCGPFKMYSCEQFVMFDVITNEINSWPDLPKGIVTYFGTVGFFIPAFIIVLLAIYYYMAMTAGYKKMEELLKDQLRSEAFDKQFLLARVDEMIRKKQERYQESESMQSSK